MNAELQQTLIDRYPDLLDIESCPWGLGMGFSVRVGAEGWFNLLDKFCKEVTSKSRSLRTDGFDCRVTYIKEKMGELRIVCEGSDDQIQALISKVRLESARTCQVCGQYGTLHILPGGVAATLCGEDAVQLSRPSRRVATSDYQGA
jgi:hypothetical protein